MTITEFLLARIAEDEQVARDAAEDRPGSWRVDGPIRGYPAPATHVARWDPVRVLSECKAKRMAVDEHGLVKADISAGTDELGCVTCTETFSWGEVVVPGPCRTLLLLASVYADHSECEDAWKLDD